LVLTALLVAVGAAAASVATTTPLYASRVTFFVTTPSAGVTDAYQGGLFSQQRVKSYATLLTGDRLAAAVAQDAALGLSAAQIQGRTSARAVPDSVLLEAVVTDADPDRSQRLAGALGDKFTALVEELETPPGHSESAVKVQVVAGPAVDGKPVEPRPVRTYTLAILLGVVLAAGVVTLRELLDTTIKSADALTEVAGAPALGVVPFDPAARRHPVAGSPAGRPARSEAFRKLRTNLQFADVDNPAKVLAVTSAVADEGKSTTAVNLAAAFAEIGSRVLLIEGDLRRPRIAHFLGIEGAAGLSNVLAGQVEFDDVVQRWGDRSLFVLPSGALPPNPSELLGSAAMSALIAEQRRRFDMIVIDTPPLLPVTDAAVVAVKVDGTIMVVRSGGTTGAEVTRAVAALRTVDARLLGCVLTMHPVADTGSTYYYASRPHGKAKAQRRQTAPAADEFTALR
jgi:capsular exopolysaccharide synthesis family protein